MSWRAAIRDFWPATLFGWALFALILKGAPAALPLALPFIGGLMVAIPFAKLTAAPALGAFFVRAKLCAAPEEFEQSV